jgi:hypothetical protein
MLDGKLNATERGTLTHGVRFECPKYVEGPAVFTGFEDGPDLVPDLPFFIA